MRKTTYEVGYGKTPVHTRFKPGQSGNKKGRPKKNSTISDLVLKEFSALQTIEKDGTRIRISNEQLFAKQLFRLALKGNPRMVEKVLDLREEGLSRKEKAESAANRAKLRPIDIRNMTEEERTKLYFESLGKLKD